MSHYLVYLIAGLVLIGGCGPQGVGGGRQRFRFENHTATLIWVHSVRGFRHDPACGPLRGDGGDALLTFPAVVIPPQAEIIWWKGRNDMPESEVFTTTIDFSTIPKSQRVGTLTFRFSKGDKWIADFKSKPK